MDTKKKLIVFFMVTVLTALSLASCGGASGGGAFDAEGSAAGETAESEAPKGGESGLSVVATIFPEYDWAREVLGENPAGVELTLLSDKGVDMHSFRPTVADILKISECDLFIYVGGESEDWVRDALSEAVNKDKIVLNLLEILGDSAREEETVEGMKAESGEAAKAEGAKDGASGEAAKAEGAKDGASGEAAETEGTNAGDSADRAEGKGQEDAEDEPEYDEHVWLSLRNAEIFVGSIAEALSELDPQNSRFYEKNAESYGKRLSELDGEYSKAISEANYDTLIFADRFPFRYMVEDYDLSYYAAFKGCEAEAEADFETIVFLAYKLDELGLPAVLKIDGGDIRIAETVLKSAENKDKEILELNSMQSVSARDTEAGESYLGDMEENLAVLRAALS